MPKSTLVKRIYIFSLVAFVVFVGASFICDYAIASEKIVFSKEYYYDSPPVQCWCSDLWAINTNGTGAQQLTNLGAPYTAEIPVLSPDGHWIAFSSSYSSWQSAFYKDIFVVGTNGAQLTRITGNQYATPTGYCTIQGLIVDNLQRDPLNEIQINISYQGSNGYYHPTKVTDRIFSYTLDNVPVPPSPSQIWVKCCVRQFVGDLIFPVVYSDQVNTISQNMELKNGNYIAEAPGWSPDMTKICGLFSSNSYDPVDSLDRSATNISIWGIDGTQSDIRNALPPYDCSPKYSPDGTKIAFGYGDAFVQSLVTVPSNNLSATPTTLAQGFIDYGTGVYYSAVFPAWSPNGTKVAFTYQALDGYMNIYGAIYIINTDLSDTVEVVPFTQNTYACYPSFSLDGSSLIYSLVTSKSSYLNLLNDFLTHNYTANIWKIDLTKGTQTQVTTDGLSSGSFCGNFNPSAIEEGSNKPLKPEVKISPNPFTTKTSIELRVQSSELKNLQLGIYDISGKLVKSFNPINSINSTNSNNSITWDARSYPAGVYFLKLSAQGGSASGGKSGNYEYTEKLILMR